MKLAILAEMLLIKYAEDLANFPTKTIKLYRGLLKSDYERNNMFRVTKHSGNVASTNYDTALHWAGQRGEEDNPGLVISFEAPISAVAQDPWFKEDFRFISDFVPINLHVIKKDIIGPIKYASTDFAADISLGAPINAQKTRILKDKLISVYDKLMKDITQFPAFQELNKVLVDDPHLMELNRLIINYVNYIEAHDLKSIFSYSNKLIVTLNQLGNSIISSGIARENVLKFDAAIKSLQNLIYKESKRILNIHDLRGASLHFPELKDILDKPPVPTWDFGPGNKKIIQPRIRQRWHHAKDLMKRLEQENKDEEATKKKLKETKRNMI